MKSFKEILYEMREILDEESFSKASILFLDSSHRFIGEVPTQETVNRLLPTLKARLQISTMITGKKIYGLEQLIQVLSELDESSMVAGYGFISPIAAGKFYFIESEDKPLGATIVDRD